MAAIGGEDLEPILHPLWEEMLQKLDLLPVERDDPNPQFMDTTLDEGLSELAHKLCLCRVLHKVADAQVVCWEGIGVDEDGFTTII